VEVLLITEADDGGRVRDSLRNLTESYLRRVVFVNVDYIQIVLRSCLLLLPESETTAFLIGRCVEALMEIGDGDCVNEFLEEAVKLPAGDFNVVADAVQQRFPRHDLLYRIVDAYVKVKRVLSSTQTCLNRLCYLLSYDWIKLLNFSSGT